MLFVLFSYKLSIEKVTIEMIIFSLFSKFFAYFNFNELLTIISSFIITHFLIMRLLFLPCLHFKSALCNTYLVVLSIHIHQTSKLCLYYLKLYVTFHVSVFYKEKPLDSVLKSNPVCSPRGHFCLPMHIL